MLQTRVRKALFSFAVVGAAALGAAGPAHAITVGATWDPYYGSPFLADGITTNENMWWSGKGDIFIPDECGVPTGTAELTCAGMEVRNAFIYLREGEIGTPFETLNFNTYTVQVNKANFVGGQLVGVDSNFFDPWQSTTATLYNVDDYEFTFGFTYDGALLYHADKDGFEKHDEIGHDDDTHFWKGVGKGHLTQSCADDAEDINKSTTACGFSKDPATVQFAVIAVPEPQTYALMLAGLAVVGFVARRRRQT